MLVAPALCAVCLLSAAVPAGPAARLRGWAGVLGPDGFRGWGALASVGLLRWLGRWFLVWFRFRGVSVLLPCLALLSVVLCCLVSGARGSVLLCGAVSGVFVPCLQSDRFLSPCNTRAPS